MPAMWGGDNAAYLATAPRESALELLSRVASETLSTSYQGQSGNQREALPCLCPANVPFKTQIEEKKGKSGHVLGILAHWSLKASIMQNIQHTAGDILQIMCGARVMVQVTQVSCPTPASRCAPEPPFPLMQKR